VERLGSASELSASQLRCLALAVSGLRSKEIARATGLSPATVDTYLSQVYGILGVRNRREAIVYCRSDPGFWGSRFSQSRSAGLAAAEKVAFVGRALPSSSADAWEGNQVNWLHDHPARPGLIKPVNMVRPLFALPPMGGLPNDFTIPQRIIAIGKITFLSIVIALVISAIVLRMFHSPMPIN
jgi:DNA-binding CsgD family transcriptional regulator